MNVKTAHDFALSPLEQKNIDKKAKEIVTDGSLSIRHLEYLIYKMNEYIEVRHNKH